MSKPKRPPKREAWREDLILNNRGLVYECANKFSRHAGAKTREDFEDLQGEGFEALCNAADTYDPENLESGFANYACVCITNSMLSYLSKGKGRRANEIQFPAYQDDFTDQMSMHALDVSIDSPPDEYGLMLSKVVASGMKALSEKDKELIRLRFYEDMGYVEMGEHLGVSFQAAQQAVKRALAKMQKVIDPEVLHERSARISRRSTGKVNQTNDLIDEIVEKTGE